ncbi:hypothetical protein GGF31_002714 [Allomyces arbusculus]|nr:hypothetical protein GGF31_002714 [Allomyces arbusculus]
MHSSPPHTRASPRATPTASTSATAANAAAASARNTTAPKSKRKTGVKRGSAYTAFMAHELKRVKALHPEMRHQDVFKLAAANWRYHPTNHKRIATATATASSSGTAPATASDGGGADHHPADEHGSDGDGQVKAEHDTGSMGDEEL